MNQPSVIAHRGASGTTPENTIAAFERALQDGSDMIEIDVWATADNTLIVFHDATTERWHGMSHVVRDTDWATLRQVRLDGEPIPTFEEVCAWAQRAGMPLNVEIKAAGFEEAAIALLHRYGLQEQVLVSSFYPAVLATMRALAPSIRRGVLLDRGGFPQDSAEQKAVLLRTLAEHEATAWHPGGTIVGLEELVPLAQQHGYAVNVWTINEPEHLEQFIRLGVDGIITNYPARLRAMLKPGKPA